MEPSRCCTWKRWFTGTIPGISGASRLIDTDVSINREVAALLGYTLKTNTENLAYFTLSGAGFEAAHHVAEHVNMFADTDYRGERL
jgi:hypothetical protein